MSALATAVFYYLVLTSTYGGIQIVPQPYYDLKDCEQAGDVFDDGSPTIRGFSCVPYPNPLVKKEDDNE
jgi:hypothetical protein